MKWWQNKVKGWTVPWWYTDTPLISKRVTEIGLNKVVKMIRKQRRNKLHLIICILLLTCTFSCLNAQKTDTIIYSDIEYSSTLLVDSIINWLEVDYYSIETFQSTNILNFGGESTDFWLDMSSDSLVWGGDMKITESAKIFIEFCDQYFYSTIDSLRLELKNSLK